MNKRILVRGTIDASGRIDPTPTIVELSPSGQVLAHYPLQGHEPAATTFSPTLLLHLSPTPHLWKQ